MAGVVVYLQYQPSPSLLVTSRSPSWFGPVEKEPPRTKNGLNLTPIKAKQKLRGDGSPRGRFERRINFYPPLVAPNTRTNYSSCGLVYVLGSLSQKGFGNSVATTISKMDSATMLRWRYLERPKRATLTPTSRRAVLPKTGLAPSLALLLVSPLYGLFQNGS